MPTGKAIDWVSIEDDYIKGKWQKLDDGDRKIIYPTYKELAKKYNCDYSTLALKGSKEKWTDKRKAYVLSQRSNRPGDPIATISELAKHENQALLRLEKLGELTDDWIEERLLPAEESNKKFVNPKDLVCIADSLNKSYKLAKNILGKPANKLSSVKIERQEIAITDSTTLNNLAQIIAARKEKSIDVEFSES